MDPSLKIALINLINATCNTPESFCKLIGLSLDRKLDTDAESSIVELGKSLADEGHEITIFISDDFKPEISLKSKNLKIDYLPTKYKSVFPPAFIPFTPSLYRKLRINDFNVIQTSDYFQLSTIISVLASLNKKTKIVVWQDLNNFPRFPGWLIIKIYNNSIGKLLQYRINLFIPKTKKSQIFLKYCKVKSDKISKVIPTGVNTKVFKPQHDSKFNLGNIENRRIILCVARLHKQKGLEYLIKAMTYVIKEYPSALLIIKGNGNLLDELENLIGKLSLTNHVRIMSSFLNRSDLVKLYNTCEFTVLPSLFETFGFVILESMACGKPIISTNIDGPREIILENDIGYLAEPESPEELSDKIILMLKLTNERMKMGLNARKLAVEKYDWNSLARKFIEAYR